MKKKNLKSYVRKICLNYKIYFGALFVISISAAFLEILVHYKIKEIIDVIAADKYASLTILLSLFVLYKLMHHGMFFIVRLLDIKYKPVFATQVSKEIYRKTIKHSLHWFDSHMSGEIADKINSFQFSFTHLITGIFRSLVILWVLVIGLIYLFKINLWIGLVQLLFLAIYTPVVFCC